MRGELWGEFVQLGPVAGAGGIAGGQKGLVCS